MTNNYELIEQSEPQTDNKEIKPVEIVFAFLALLFGIELINLFQYAAGVFMTAYCILFTAATLIYAYKKLGRLNTAAWTGAALIIAYSSSFLVFDNDTLKGWGTALLCLAIPYWYYRIFGCRKDADVDELTGFDLIKAIIIIPFSNFIKIFVTLFKDAKKRKGFSTVTKILLGLAIALIPCIAVVSLLINADEAFSNLSSMLFTDILRQLAKYILPVLLGVPTAMYLFGMMFGCSENNRQNILTPDACSRAAKKMRAIPTVAVCSALTPLILVYILFFIAQSGYFLSAFSNIVPEGMTVAEYARNGFFELCAVSAINALLIILLGIFGKRREDGTACIAVKIYNIIFSVLTIALVATAISKMALYINVYGLTLKRVYATWAMVLIALSFILLIIKQAAKKFNVIRACAVLFAAMFFGLTFCDIDSVIAKYNTDIFIADSASVLDIEMFSDLSGSALPYLADVYDKVDETGKAEIQNVFADYYANASNDFNSDFRAFNIVRYKAVRLAKEKGFSAMKAGLYFTFRFHHYEAEVYGIGWTADNASGATVNANGTPFADGDTVYLEKPASDSFELTLYGLNDKVLTTQKLSLTDTPDAVEYRIIPYSDGSFLID